MQPIAFTLEVIPMMVWQATWQAACLALMVWCVVQVLDQRIAAKWRFALWSLVFVRLALPMLPASPTSVFQLLKSPMTQSTSTDVKFTAAQTSVPIIKQVELPTADLATPASSSGSELLLSRPVPIGHETIAIDSAPSQRSDWIIHSSWFSSCVIIWLIGVCMLMVRRACQSLQLRRKIRQWRIASSERISSILTRCARRIGVASSVTVLTTDDQIGPAITGIWSPRVVVPEPVLRDFTDAQLEMIFCHELAHIRRRDLLLQEAFLFLRAIHWFNPIVWWALQQVQLQREMACDEFVLESTGQQRQPYGLTLLQIAQQAHTRVATPGLLGTSDTSSSLQRRLVLIRDYRTPTWKMSFVAMTSIVALVAVGLTNPPVIQSREEAGPAAQSTASAKPFARAQDTSTQKAVLIDQDLSVSGPFEIKGSCVNDDGGPLADTDVSLFYFERYGVPPQKIWQQKTNASGEYHFQDLKPLAKSERTAWTGFYVLMAKKPNYASSGRMVRGEHDIPRALELAENTGILSGRVTNERGEPISNAEVYFGFPGVRSAVTDENGRYSIPDLPTWKLGSPESVQLANGEKRTVTARNHFFWIKHRDFPVTQAKYSAVPQKVNVVLKPGIAIEGRVVENGQPVAGAKVTVQAVNQSSRRPADDFPDSDHVLTAADGSYRLMLRDDLYNIWAHTEDRISVALDSFTGVTGQVTKAPALELIEGGFIAGRIIDDETGQPFRTRPEASPFQVAHHGPGFPDTGAAVGTTSVQKDGSYRLRVAPGLNYVYLMERQQLNQQISVRNGETVIFDFHVNGTTASARKFDEFVPRRTRNTGQLDVNDATDRLSAQFEPRKDPPPVTATAISQVGHKPAQGPFEIKGRCLDEEKRPLSGVLVRLFYVEKDRSPPLEQARLTTDSTGEYRFDKLKTPYQSRDLSRHSFADYYFVVATKAKHASTFTYVDERYLRAKITQYDLTLSSKTGTLSGRVTNERGEPVAGAVVHPGYHKTPIAGFHDAVTDQAGRYAITDLEIWDKPRKIEMIGGGGFTFLGAITFTVTHPGFPDARAQFTAIPQEVNVEMKAGVTVEGRVIHKGAPVAGASVTAEGLVSDGHSVALTDAQGQYRFLLPPDKYNIGAIAKDLVGIAIDSRECKVGKAVQVPDLQLVEGGFIVGKLVDKETGQPISKSYRDIPLRVAHFGPAFPKSGFHGGSAEVAPDGTYRMRVAPGENYPYLDDGNYKAERSHGNTLMQKPIIVREGETVAFDMHLSKNE